MIAPLQTKPRLATRPAIAVRPTTQLYAFESDLGWMAALTLEGRVAQLVFGGQSPQSACGQLDAELLNNASAVRRPPDWARLLRSYAAGKPVDLQAVPLHLPESLTSFQKQIFNLCRAIPYGQIATYGELAEQAGHARAARAVGNCMATNRLPLVVPCHRVVPAGGKLGQYSAPGGVRTKLRLLEMEGCRQSALLSRHLPVQPR